MNNPLRIPRRLRYDRLARVWVAKAGTILTQGTTMKEAWAALRNGVKMLRKLKKKRTMS